LNEEFSIAEQQSNVLNVERRTLLSITPVPKETSVRSAYSEGKRRSKMNDEILAVPRPVIDHPEEQAALAIAHSKIDAETERAIRKYENPQLAFSDAEPSPESPEWLRRKIAAEEMALRSDIARLSGKPEGAA
jgi:hypothetical protein